MIINSWKTCEISPTNLHSQLIGLEGHCFCYFSAQYLWSCTVRKVFDYVWQLINSIILNGLNIWPTFNRKWLMYDIRELIHSLIDVSRFLIGITKVMESRSPILGSHSESHWNYGKIEHENGLKLWPSNSQYILM